MIYWFSGYIYRFHKRDLCPTRAYVQKHFSDTNDSTVIGKLSNPGKERLLTIREGMKMLSTSVN